MEAARSAITPVAPIISFVIVNTTTTGASTGALHAQRWRTQTRRSRLPDLAAGLAVDDATTQIATICIGDGNYSVFTAASELNGTVLTSVGVLRAVPTRKAAS